MRIRFCDSDVKRGSPCYPFLNDFFRLGKRGFYTGILKKCERIFRGNIRPIFNPLVPIVTVWLAQTTSWRPIGVGGGSARQRYNMEVALKDPHLGFH